ncbi:hypothetical protein V2J09_015913 [Rumex salicifolius]
MGCVTSMEANNFDSAQLHCWLQCAVDFRMEGPGGVGKVIVGSEHGGCGGSCRDREAVASWAADSGGRIDLVCGYERQKSHFCIPAHLTELWSSERVVNGVILLDLIKGARVEISSGTRMRSKANQFFMLSQSKEYGSCIAAKIPEVERDMCLKEFLALKQCMQNVISICIRAEALTNIMVLSYLTAEDKTLRRKMHSEASSSQPNISLNGSGALSHVCIQYPPLRCSISGSKGFFYDDGNKLLLSPTSDQVFSWKVSPFDPNVAPTSEPFDEGHIISLRYSLDTQILAIQRSNNEIQFWNQRTEETFSYKCRPETENILGFFWTDCASCDIVIVKTSGLDLLSYDSILKSLRLNDTKKMNVSWYVYTHESRLVLLASGLQCKTFVGFQLSSSGIIRLPKFDMVMAKLEANSRPVLSAEDVHIITVYGRIYCLQVDKVAMLLHCYRFYRDAVVQQGSLSIYSSKIAVSVVDNVLLVHQVDAKVVILYDIFADSRAPISAPLPLLLKGYPRASPSPYGEDKDNEGLNSKDKIDQESVLYGDDWTFLVPDLICDTSKGLLWKVQLDLEAISASSSEAPLIIEFLQRRKLEANKAKKLCLAIARTIILERRPVAIVARAMDVLVTSYSNAIKSGIYFKGLKSEKMPSSSTRNISSPRMHINESSKITDPRGKSIKTEVSGNQSSVYSASDSEEEGTQFPGSNRVPLATNLSEQQHESQITSAAISPSEIYQHVFALVDEEMAGDPAYLISIIVEFLRSANVERIRTHPNLYVLTIQLLSRSGKYAELGLFIINKIIEPSREVAMQLLESGRQNYETKKLGMDILRQLSLHQEYILSLVQDGYYLESLRYARKHKVSTIRPTVFLEAAYGSNNPEHLAAVLRFLSDFIPGFKNTSDSVAYCRILSEIGKLGDGVSEKVNDVFVPCDVELILKMKLTDPSKADELIWYHSYVPYGNWVPELWLTNSTGGRPETDIHVVMQFPVAAAFWHDSPALMKGSKLQLSSLPSNNAGPVKWRKPREGWVKINCDATLACGGDGGLGLLLGSHISRDSDAIELLEAEAILWGMCCCIEKGFRKIEVESDSLAVISKLRKEKPWKGARNCVKNIDGAMLDGMEIGHFLANPRPLSIICSFFLSSFSLDLNSLLLDDLN